MIIDRRKLWGAPFAFVLRLARFVGAATPPDGCECIHCREKTIEHVARACEIDDVGRIIGSAS